MNKIKKWYKYERDAVKDCPIDCIVVPYSWIGYPAKDVYKIIKKEGIHRVSSIPHSARRGIWRINRTNIIVISVDGRLYSTTKYKFEKYLKNKEFFDSKSRDQLINWFQGYFLFSEFEKINEYKERARISHIVCDCPGEDGHNQRQKLRKEYNGGAEFL